MIPTAFNVFTRAFPPGGDPSAYATSFINNQNAFSCSLKGASCGESGNPGAKNEYICFHVYESFPRRIPYQRLGNPADQEKSSYLRQDDRDPDDVIGEQLGDIP